MDLNQKLERPATAVLFSCLETGSKKIKQRVRKLCKASTVLAYWDMHKDDLDKFVQSILSPGADYEQALLFFKLLQQATGDVSRPMQDENAIVEIMYRSYLLSMSNCWKLWINITPYPL